MQQEPGDEYLRRTAAFIRTHEQKLADAGAARRSGKNASAPATSSMFNPMGWIGLDTSTPRARPMVLSMDTHHLYYILIRLEALGIDIGSLDVKVDNPSRPVNYITLPGGDTSDTMSISSFRSTFSAVSRLSLGSAWWGRSDPPKLDVELKYIYSSFTKLPSLSIHAPGPKVITELANDSPIDSALPLDAFKNVQYLECLDIDPRTLLGWDRLAESLRSLIIKRSGIEDMSDIFIDAVVDDQVRRDGSTSRPRRRRLVHSTSPRQPSFYGTRTRLSKTVPEDEEEFNPTTEVSRPLSPPPSLSRLKWAFLKHLSLADNALTFFPTAPIPHLASLTHLDLSSNLLVSVPPGLSSLYNLVSLNLSDNMIDSVLGIYTNLGQIYTLNLSHNRLESICGLERLAALERVDLRNNAIDDSAEVGRLATLPNIAEVLVDGNSFVETEEDYRVKCFNYFSREGKNIMLDGSLPSFSERRQLTSPHSDRMHTRALSTAYSPPVVAVGGTSQPMPPIVSDASSILPSPPSSPGPSPGLSAAVNKSRRRKNKRVVDLDGGVGKDSGAEERDRSHPRMVNHNVVRDASPSKLSTSPPDMHLLEYSQHVEDASETHNTRPIMQSRHSRHRTEFPSSTALPVSTSASVLPQNRMATLSSPNARRSRRARVSASVYEPSIPDIKSGEVQGPSDAEAFRARVEALRAEVGDSWLKVLSQSQFGSSSPSIAKG